MSKKSFALKEFRYGSFGNVYTVESGDACSGDRPSEVSIGGMGAVERGVHDENDDGGSGRVGNDDTENDVTVQARLRRRDVLIVATLCLILFVDWTSISLLSPFYPNEAAKKGASATATGFVISVFYLVMLTTAPVVGRLTTRFGTRHLLAVGAFCHGFFTIVFGLLEYVPPGWPFVLASFAVRTLQSLGASVTQTTTFAFISSSYPDRSMTFFGIIETFVGLGSMLGPVVGGLLFEAGGFGLPFYMCGGVGIITSIAAFLMIPEISGLLTGVIQESGNSGLQFLMSPGAVVSLASIVACGFLASFLNPILSPRLAILYHLRPAVIGAIFFMWSGVYAIIAPIQGYLIQKYDCAMSFMITGAIGSFLSLLLLGPAPFFHLTPALWMTLLGMVAVAILFSGMYIAPISALHSVAFEMGLEQNVETHGMIAGVFNSLYSLGSFVGASAAGGLVDLVGFEWTCVVTAGLFAILAAVLVAYAAVRLHSHDFVFGRINDPSRRGRENST